MDTNPVIEMLGRRLRLAVIGGGPGSFIGSMHRTAARIDDRYQLVAGAISSDPERSRLAGAALGIER
ncbi:MAG: gfo/Idh/MocA family oxidoreductase, partial [bacterium]|nr:gfo/Idh/MocA family oxidoreductase [bacterium]